MTDTPIDRQSLIAELEAELSRLRVARTMAYPGARVRTSTGSQKTIAGLTELALHVTSEKTVGFLNQPMARLLGISDRKSALGRPLSEVDDGPLGPGFLRSLSDLAADGETQVIDRQLEEDDASAHPTYRFTTTGLSGATEILAQDVTQLVWLENTFARCVSPAVIDQMLTRPREDFLQMQRREVTVLFARLIGLDVDGGAAEEVAKRLNAYLTDAVAIIESHDGTINKLVGETVMCFFGAPMEQPDHPVRALVCALELAALADVGVGLQSGPTVVGNVGTLERMDYTALGHTTNLAARLAARAATGEVLTTPTTHRAAMTALPQYQGNVPRVGFEPKGRVAFKNVAGGAEVVLVKKR